MKKEKCPICGLDLQVLLFMGCIPDGLACSGCQIYFAPREDKENIFKPLKPLAKVI